MKKVKIINPMTSEAVTIESNATTFGELAVEISEVSSLSGLNLSECKVFLKDSSGSKTLGLTSDTLSEEDSYKVFISPTKMKAGNGTRYSDAVLKELKTKVNNIFTDLIGGEAATDEPNFDGEVTEDDLEEFDEIVNNQV